MYKYKNIGDLFEGKFNPTWSIRDALNQVYNILLLGMSGTFPKGSSYLQKVLGNISLPPRSLLLMISTGPESDPWLPLSAANFG